MTDDRFEILRHRLKWGEHLTFMEKKEYARLGREMIQVWRHFPLTEDVKRSIRKIQSDMRMVNRDRVKARKQPQDPMREVLM
jgi:hypothetical protein